MQTEERDEPVNLHKGGLRKELPVDFTGVGQSMLSAKETARLQGAEKEKQVLQAAAREFHLLRKLTMAAALFQSAKRLWIMQMWIFGIYLNNTPGKLL